MKICVHEENMSYGLVVEEVLLATSAWRLELNNVTGWVSEVCERTLQEC